MNSSNTAYSSDSYGVLFNKNKTKLIQCPGGYSGDYTVPGTVTSLDSYCFAFCPTLNEVKLPASVTSIGSAVFSNSPNVGRIVVNENNPNFCNDYNGTLYNKNKTELIRCPGAFATHFVVPSTVKTIASSAFEGCPDLWEVTIPTSVTAIGFAAFRDCTALQSVSIPKSVTDLGSYVFEDCSALYDVTLPSNLKQIPDGLFVGCSEMGETFTIPSAVTKIGENAFNGCSTLWAVTIPDGVTEIGPRAFGYCYNLTEVNLPKNLKTIGERAFLYCYPLESYDIPYGVTSIGASAFYGCEGFTPKNADGTKASSFYVRIPETVTSIGSKAFGYMYISGSGEQKISGFVIRGVSGTAAQTYANNNNITFSAVAKPTIYGQPKNASASIGNSAVFKVDASGEDLQYQWQYKKSGESSWTDWGGATSKSLSVTASATNGGCQYRCLVTAYGVARTTSSAATLTVTGAVEKPKITSQPKDATVALGASTTFKVTATGTGIKYQWQFRKAGTSTWYDWSGKTSASLPVTGSNTNNGCQYRCVVSNSAGHVNSAAATLTVTGASAKPTITTQPSNQSTTLSKSVSFKVAASGSGLSYQWQFSKDNGSSWSSWSGKTSATLTVTASATNNGCLYRCVVKNSSGSVTSGSARLTVTNSKPVILVQPKAASVALGSSTTFKVVAWGSGLSYQWQFSKDGGTNWYDWSGKTSASLPVTGSSTNNGCLYRCVVKNSYGSVTSSQVKLTVT